MLDNSDSDVTNLLLQVPLSIFLVAAGLLEFFDAGLLLLKLLVVAGLFLDKAVDCRGCDCELRRRSHFDNLECIGERLSDFRC